jgi:hypothetical protein
MEVKIIMKLMDRTLRLRTYLPNMGFGSRLEVLHLKIGGQYG